ncbi:2-dehydro-3-deoxygalactonokinase [Chelatococcus asaccharovorans]|uniref:2-dehydro-3-deoxygalactonokinase n=1 Tax=Chelatococcus asaccharovorans TaxID=28210 RepID=UPI00224C66A0|nr:2-dehydro-3-deoxygalactonokinase [Chelatococcus asaccharovorans]CAH1671235.1 2-dehydro-3-deoxygalactonokinase [Chelatococcus asaccharovorans]CAH1677346.1 2-dehydro-3-deoxygalactonokinase [Chelatococcus asaccharovorans]
MSGNQGSEAGRPRLIALDWGTSSLRGFLMGKDAGIIDQRASSHGIQNLPEPGIPGFEKAFAALCGPWLARWPDLPVVAGGMVGSAQGWVEAPYVPCPADVAELARHAGRVTTADGRTILIAPGVIDDPADAPPDVMRGEEIQIAGALADNPSLAERASIIMPGTHSKWVSIAASRITHFDTYMTGEVFAVMTTHSILGRLMTSPAEGPTADPAAADAAFCQGVLAARESRAGDLLNQLFSVRTLGLTRRLSGLVLRDYLSGLLIGQELTSGVARLKQSPATLPPIVLIGDDRLCSSYRRAMALFDITPAALLGNTAPSGLFRFAAATGMLQRA